MDPQLIDAALNAGGLALAVMLVLHWQRSDVQKHERAQEKYAEALTKLIEDAHREQRLMTEGLRMVADAVKLNTDAFLALKTSVEQGASIKTLETRLIEMERLMNKR